MTQTSNSEIPNHVGLILDGNRRWAKAQGLPSLEGHRRGYDNLKVIIEKAADRGVKHISAFIFSTENWDRSKEEVSYLMVLAMRMMQRDVKELHKENIRVRWLGSPEGISEKLLIAISKAQELTKDNRRATLDICFNYGGKKEIVDGVKKLMAADHNIAELSEDEFAGFLYEPDVPPVDLLIRTSGEQRISGFMLWRAAYAELYFVKKHWPDFGESDLDKALEEYSRRQRRFGK